MNKKIHTANLLFMIFITVLSIISVVLLYFLALKDSGYTINKSNFFSNFKEIWKILKTKKMVITISILTLISLAIALHILLFIFIIFGAIDGFKNNSQPVGVLYIIGAFVPMSLFTFIASCVGISKSKQN